MIGAQRGAGGNQVGDCVSRAQAGRNLDRAGELDDLGFHALFVQKGLGQAGIACGDAFALQCSAVFYFKVFRHRQ